MKLQGCHCYSNTKNQRYGAGVSCRRSKVKEYPFPPKSTWRFYLWSVGGSREHKTGTQRRDSLWAQGLLVIMRSSHLDLYRNPYHVRTCGCDLPAATHMDIGRSRQCLAIFPWHDRFDSLFLSGGSLIIFSALLLWKFALNLKIIPFTFFPWLIAWMCCLRISHC